MHAIKIATGARKWALLRGILSRRLPILAGPPMPLAKSRDFGTHYKRLESFGKVPSKLEKFINRMIYYRWLRF